MTTTYKKDFCNTAHPANQDRADDRPALTIDVDHFQQFLNCPDIPEERKREMIETIWSIVVSVIDLGFGVHPLQQAQQSSSDPSVSKDSITGMLRQIALEDGVLSEQEGETT